MSDRIGRAPRSRTFGMVLYPQEDNLHKFVFDYYSNREDCVWIEHDRDIFTEHDFLSQKCEKEDIGTLKKKHIHFLVRFKNPRSSSQMSKDLTFNVTETIIENDVEVKKIVPKSIHFEVISSYESMIRYFIHDTIDCVYMSKTKYDPSLLQGCKQMITTALSYYYPVCEDVYAQLVDYIITNQLPYHKFVQYMVGNFPIGSPESECFYQNKYDFSRLCNSLVQYEYYLSMSSSKKLDFISSFKDGKI